MFQTLLINLEISKQRLEFQTKQLSALNLAFTRVPAISSHDILDADYEYMASDWERKLRKTEVACFLSHYKAWEIVANSNQPALILEDDVLLSKDSLKLLEALKNIKCDYHHITLETRARKKLIATKGISINNLCHVHRLYQDRTGAAAYILTPTGAKILMANKQNHTIGLVDAIICSSYDLLSYQVVPAFAVQSDLSQYYNIEDPFVLTSQIDIEAKPKLQNLTFKEKLVFKLRRIYTQIRIGHRFLQNRAIAKKIFISIKPNDFKIKL